MHISATVFQLRLKNCKIILRDKLSTLTCFASFLIVPSFSVSSQWSRCYGFVRIGVNQSVSICRLFLYRLVKKPNHRHRFNKGISVLIDILWSIVSNCMYVSHSILSQTRRVYSSLIWYTCTVAVCDFLIYIQSYDTKCEANLNHDFHSWIIYSVRILNDCYLIDYAPLSKPELNRF